MPFCSNTGNGLRTLVLLTIRGASGGGSASTQHQLHFRHEPGTGASGANRRCHSSYSRRWHLCPMQGYSSMGGYG